MLIAENREESIRLPHHLNPGLRHRNRQEVDQEEGMQSK